MIVVTCPSCGFGKVAQSGVARTKCSHCGKAISISKALKHYEGEDAGAARTALFIINAGMKPHQLSPGAVEKARKQGGAAMQAAGRKTAGRSMGDFLSSHDSFGIDEFAAFLGISQEQAETRIMKLAEAGAVYSSAKGVFRVVS